MTTPDRIDPDAGATAAELALGVLDGDERAAAMRRVLAEPEFAREVETWRTHFALLFAQWPDVSPGDELEDRIIRLTHAVDSRRGSIRPRGWAIATGVATLIAACLVLALALRPQRIVTVREPAPAAAAPALVAAIAPTDGGAEPFAATYDAAIGEVRLAGGVDVPAGHSAELWVIAGKGDPHALGLIAGNTARVSIGGSNLRRMAAGVTLAVSIEPAGGSPTGLPTGPVVAQGKLTST